MHFLQKLLSPKEFVPGTCCSPWEPDLVWIHVVSDTVIAFSCYFVPVVLFLLLHKRRREMTVGRIVTLLGLFLILCGANQLLEMVVLQHPVSPIMGLAKVAIALVLLCTAISLFVVVRQLLALPGTAQIEETLCSLRLSEQQNHRTSAQVEEMERVNRLKDEFLSTASHELRTPVFNMKMAIKMLGVVHQQVGSQPQKLSRYMGILTYECDREIDLINDLLDLQRLERETQPLNIETIHVDSWLNSLCGGFSDRFSERHQVFTLHLSEPLPAIQSNVTALTRILSELLNNACKYTPAGQSICCIAALEGNLLTIDVVNSGSTIPEADLPFIFNKFYRANTTDPWKAGGTGLGLALTRKLCESLGGDIQVQSNLTETRFTVKVPVLVPSFQLVANEKALGLNSGRESVFLD